MKISIPQPCNENWATMLPNEKGRFCNNCQKTVIDFTQMSDEQVIEWVSTKNSCGRLTKNQLHRINKILQQKEQFHLPKWSKFSAAALLILGTQSTSLTQVKEPIITEQHQNNLTTDSINLNTQILKGTVIDGDGFPLSDVEITLKDYNEVVFTDFDGNFEINLPNNNTNWTLIVNDYYKSPIEFLVNKNETNQVITYDPLNVNHLSGVILVSPKRTFAEKVLDTLTWPFRKIVNLFN